MRFLSVIMRRWRMVCIILLQQSTSKAINRYLTIRNWLIGFHIVEFEQNGEDRRRYGQGLVEEMAEALDAVG